jgi:hypothetical protein
MMSVVSREHGTRGCLAPLLAVETEMRERPERGLFAVCSLEGKQHRANSVSLDVRCNHPLIAVADWTAAADTCIKEGQDLSR